MAFSHLTVELRNPVGTLFNVNGHENAWLKRGSIKNALSDSQQLLCNFEEESSMEVSGHQLIHSHLFCGWGVILLTHALHFLVELLAKTFHDVCDLCFIVGALVLRQYELCLFKSLHIKAKTRQILIAKICSLEHLLLGLLNDTLQRLLYLPLRKRVVIINQLC